MSKERELLERALESLDGNWPRDIDELQKEIRAYLAQPEEREALSDGEINKGWWAGPDFIDLGAFSLGVRFAEKHHGIGGGE